MDISGFLRLSPVICEMVCGGDLQGTIYYDSFYNKICYCNGAHWMMLDGGGYCECVDLDGDNYDNCDPEHPYDTDGLPADCDDANDNIYPGNTEYCDGLDNDCNPGTPDGSTDPNLGMTCDGPDSDLCDEGIIICDDGSYICTDNTDDNLDICDGIDNDCDPASADGSEDPMNGSPCDGPDSDLCQEGVFNCVAGMFVCTDNTGNNLDICDGIDNDCDPASPDGSEDPLVGSPCDGPDSDLCPEGVYICSGGALQCTDTSGDNVEICDDNIDNDCDGLTDSEDPDCQ
jgi:hypothetical protein